MWWKKLTGLVANELFPETNSVARVVYQTPAMEGLDDTKFEWRVKRRGDGFTMISLQIQYPGGGEDGPPKYSIDFQPEIAGAIKASLDACVAEYERLKTEPRY
jgi:hypothetical protein